MNMSASVMLTNLPRDVHQALADVESIDAGKGDFPFSGWALAQIIALTIGFMFQIIVV